MNQKNLMLPIVGAAIGGLLGVGLAFFGSKKKNKRNGKKTLPFDWQFVEGDDFAKTCMQDLLKFRITNNDRYKAIGDSIDNLIRLQCLLTQERQGQKQEGATICYSHYAFKNRDIITKQLTEWSGDIKEYNDQVKKMIFNGYDEQDKLINQVEFYTLASSVEDVAEVYYTNICSDELTLLNVKKSRPLKNSTNTRRKKNLQNISHKTNTVKPNQQVHTVQNGSHDNQVDNSNNSNQVLNNVQGTCNVQGAQDVQDIHRAQGIQQQYQNQQQQYQQYQMHQQPQDTYQYQQPHCQQQIQQQQVHYQTTGQEHTWQGYYNQDQNEIPNGYTHLPQHHQQEVIPNNVSRHSQEQAKIKTSYSESVFNNLPDAGTNTW
jgi:hypothetical protein